MLTCLFIAMSAFEVSHVLKKMCISKHICNQTMKYAIFWAINLPYMSHCLFVIYCCTFTFTPSQNLVTILVCWLAAIGDYIVSEIAILSFKLLLYTILEGLEHYMYFLDQICKRFYHPKLSKAGKCFVVFKLSSTCGFKLFIVKSKVVLQCTLVSNNVFWCVCNT